jgi:hypothetical protein
MVRGCLLDRVLVDGAYRMARLFEHHRGVEP